MALASHKDAIIIDREDDLVNRGRSGPTLWSELLSVLINVIQKKFSRVTCVKTGLFLKIHVNSYL